MKKELLFLFALTTLNFNLFSQTVEFEGTPTTVVVGQTVDFSDLSTGYTIISWNWYFEGAESTSSTIQNPEGIQYLTVGTYDVRLIINDGTTIDTLLKPDYIEVIESSVPVANFTADITEIIPGQTVSFSDLSTDNQGITSYSWVFTGADITTSTIQNPQIPYSNPGYYTVKLTVSNNENNSDTEIKENYIHVLDPDSLSKADFQANQTTIIPGATINFTNLSTLPTYIDSSQWILENADAPNNNIIVMANGNNNGVTYTTIPGNYDATLIIYCSFGIDTMLKKDYIYVIDTSNFDTVISRFKATTVRLIKETQTVEFTDMSVGPVTSWHWEFEGGTPATYNGQYPPPITYNSANGPYDVCLKVNNINYTDSTCKYEYIVVTTTDWLDPDGYCDEDLNNLPSGVIPHPAMHLTSEANQWGYFPGHNYLKVKYYAEKFTNYTFDRINEIHIAPSRIQDRSSNFNKVKYYIWAVDSLTGMPGEVLGTKLTYVSDYTQHQYYSVIFNEPVEIPAEFYVGFYIKYPSISSGEAQDTFAVYYSGNRADGINTTVVSKTNGNWKTPTQMLGDTINMSLDLRLKACLIEVKDIDYIEEVKLYPNPTTGKVTIELGDIPIINPIVKVYDLTGRVIYSNCIHVYGNTYELDLKNQKTGFYLVNINFGDVQITKKITLIK